MPVTARDRWFRARRRSGTMRTMTKDKTPPAVGRLVLVRHGQSDWNQKNLFTGWTDVDLTAQGCEEARQAGRTLVKEHLSFDIAFTSVLTRAIRTLWLVLDEMKLMWLPVEKLVALERASLRLAARARQSADDGQARRGTGEDLAPQLRHSTAAARRERRAPSAPRSALRGVGTYACCRAPSR